MGWKSRHSDGRHFRTKPHTIYPSNQWPVLNWLTTNLEEATDNAKVMLESFNQAQTREGKRKIKQKMVSEANKNLRRNRKIAEIYKEGYAQMVLPSKEKPMPFREKINRKTEILGLEIKKETKETQMSHVPSEIKDEKGKSVGVDAKYGLVGIGGSLAESEKITFKVPKERKEA